jgi:hypothetical protein
MVRYLLTKSEMNRGRLSLLAIAGALALPALFSLTRPVSTTPSVLTLVSGGYRLDKIYRSMEGPWSVQSGIQVARESKPAVQWITGLETQVVDAARQTPVSQEFFCHSNLTFAEHSGGPEHYNEELGGKTHLDWRLFSLVPGQLSIELPPGFGVPLPSDALLDYVTMSLNLNLRSEAVNVRMRTKIHTIAANQPGAPTKALFRRALYVMQREDKSGIVNHACMAKPGKGQSGSDHIGLGCGELVKVNLPNGSAMVMPAEGMTNHWTIPQGNHVYTTEITPQLNLPFDTTVHYATIHVHPFARAVELRDLTIGKTILRLNSQDWPDRVGVAHVEEFKSIDGIPILRSHRYELAVEYDNTSGSDTDAMAILYLYLLDKNLM